MIYTNSVVVIGDRFNPDMFKPEEFFDHPVDAGRVVVGPVAQYSYNSGRCRLSMNPSRIDLMVVTSEIMPEELHTAAGRLVSIIDGFHVATTVTGLGLNCDAALRRLNGILQSNRMANLNLMKRITGASAPQAATVVSFHREDLQYTMRIKPEVKSQGQSLFVAINGHQ